MLRDLNITLVYIAADSRSGSTLLDLLIGAHKDVVSVGELRRLHDHYNGFLACTCEALFSDCPFWGRVNSELENSGKSLAQMETLIPRSKSPLHDLAYFLPGPLLVMLSKWIEFLGRAFRIADNNLLIADTVCETQNVQVLVDSSKVFKFSRLYNLIRPGHVKTIFLVRDGRGTCYSRKKDGARFNSTVTGWVLGQFKFLFLRLILPSRSRITIYYEKLCENPDREVEKVFQFIGVEPEKRHALLNKENRHNVCGNPMRFEKSSTEIRLDEQWKNELSKTELKSFKVRGGELINWVLGYR